MFNPINGFTKRKMKQIIRTFNDGTKAFDHKMLGCLYETPEGNRCAIGCFLPNDPLYLDFEGDVGALVQDLPEVMNFMPLELEGLDLMQKAHDEAKEGQDVREVLCNWIDKNVKARRK